MKIKEYSILLCRASMVALMLSAGAAIYAQTTMPRVVAHRGYWRANGSAQNSIRSLCKADSIGAWGTEFDVWRTADGHLYVNHDKTFKGVTISEATGHVAGAIELDNGESMPTLRQLLEEARKHPNLQLIFELKEHSDARAERLAVAEGVALVKELGLADRTHYITFSKNAYMEFLKHAPAGAEVQYLTGDLTPAQVKVVGGTGIDYSQTALRQHPEWIQEAHALGMTVNVWTVDKPEDIQWWIEQGVDFITTNEPVLAAQLIEQYSSR